MTALEYLPDDVPLAAARDWLRTRALDGGAHCPCCTQYAKVYRRKLTSATGRALCELWRAAGQRFAYLPDVVSVRADEAKARYWGLIESRGEYRDDGSPRSGFWRLTDDGVGFVSHRYRVPAYALIYDGRCLGLEGEPVGIDDVLGSRFDYGELMGGQ